MNKLLAPLVVSLGLIGIAPAQGIKPPYLPDTGSVAIDCGRLIDGVSDTARGRTLVVIRAGRIESVGTGTPPVGVKVIDLSQYTCLPGLIDMHTHLLDRPEDTADLRVYFKRRMWDHIAVGRDNAAITLAAGFTTVRNLGVYLQGTDTALRDAINAGAAIGPRMAVSGPYLTIPGGGGDLLVPGFQEPADNARFHAGVARGAEQFRERATQIAAQGVDVIKLIASGAVLAYGGVPGSPEMTPEEIRAVVEVAHAKKLRVAAHAHGAQSIKDAIRAGVDTVEHVSYLDDEGIRLALEHRTALVMDIYGGDWIDVEGRAQKWPAEFLRKNLETTEVQRQSFTRAVKAGVPLPFGTDSSIYPHGLNARQFKVMVERGMTPAQAIQSATSVAASYLGWADRVGSLEPGRFGDLIAVRGDPLADVSVLEKVAVVVKGGLVFRHAGG
jgi:imidazolonepropionase-like amidohydrolase